jgi:hypothetical protein
LGKIKVKFAKDEEWLELVRQGRCPECLDQPNTQNRRLLKKGIKRECSQGHLTIYGNPEYVAYQRIYPNKSSDGCHNCTNREITYDKKHDEIICTNQNCTDHGMVLSGPPQFIPPGRWVEYPQGNRFDYSDVDKTYSPYEDDRCDYGDYIE